MKIVIDIGHPAHVHYFRNFIKIMEKKGHTLLVFARDKEVSQNLLNQYDIPYVSRGKGSSGFFGKLTYLIKTDFILLFKALPFKPDIFLSFSSPYAAQVAWLLRKPHIAFTDTEHAKIENIASIPFSSTVITPQCFLKDFGKKHIRFNGFLELFYLHKNYFTSNKDIFKLLNIKDDENYIILRFVSWGASHDIGHSGLNDETKRELVEELSKDYKIFISSETELPKEFIQYKLNISPEKMHDVLDNAHLFIGEGATMASECAMLGTPAIYVNTLSAGTLIAQEDSGSIFSFNTSVGVLKKAIEILETPNLEKVFEENSRNLLHDSIDVTAFAVWFVENYPKSIDTIKDNPDFQSRFK